LLPIRLLPVTAAPRVAFLSLSTDRELNPANQIPAVDRSGSVREPRRVGKIIGSLAAEWIKQIPGGSVVTAIVDQDTLREGAREIVFGAAKTLHEWLVNTLGNLDDADFFQSPGPLLIEKFSSGLEKCFGESPFLPNYR
jgi:hypothetical protein